MAAHRRCAVGSVRCCARLVVFQLFPNSTVFPPPLLLSLAPALSLSLSPSRSPPPSRSLSFAHSTVTGYERTKYSQCGCEQLFSCNSLSPMHDVRRGGGGRDLAQRLGFYPVRAGLREGYLDIQINPHLSVTALMHQSYSCSCIDCLDSKACSNS